MALLFLDRVSYKREIKHRQTHDAEVAVVDFGGAVDIHLNALGIEVPLGMGQFAGGDRSLTYQVVVGSLFFDDFSSEGKRIGGGQDIAGFAQPQSYGSNHAVECPNLGADIVSAMAGFHVLVVGAAIQNDVTLQFAIPGIGVVSDLIRVEDIGAIVNLDCASQMVDRAIFLLLHGADGDLFFCLGCSRSRGSNR